MNQIEYYEYKLEYEFDSADLVQALKNREKIVIIDARRKKDFACAHIPGAINHYHVDMCEETTAAYDKSFLYVTYCDGIGCNGSTKGAVKLCRLGFRVKELLGGLDWWQRDGHPVHGGCAKTIARDNESSCGC